MGFEPLPGGAGARRYWRCTTASGARSVLMHALPEDARILPPALRSEADTLPFVEVGAFLAAAGFPVPAVLAVDRGERRVLLEDLGDTHLCDLEAVPLRERLFEAMALLARVHAVPRSAALPFQRRFDADWVRFELGTFVEHGVPAAARAAVEGELDGLVEAVAALPRVLSLRDFQSQNLMVDREGALRIIDYQDALLAPRELDLAALLHDSYLEIDDDLREGLLAHYEREARTSIDPGALALLVVQRKCKDLGRFRYLVEVAGDARFGAAMDRARASVVETLPRLPDALRSLACALEGALGGPGR